MNKESKPENIDCYDIYGERILIALRRIIRAVVIHSKKLNSDYKITVPQMICLKALAENNALTQKQLAQKVNLSVSTVNGIIDRLESKELIKRERDTVDRRKVTISITENGHDLIDDAPSLLQDNFARAMKLIPDIEIATIAFSLEKVVQLMEAENIDASPNLLINNIPDNNNN